MKPFRAALPAVCAIAHRGGAALFPENTLLAFGEAVRRFAPDMLELDVHVTLDGALVVSHDPTVERCTNGSGEFSSLTLAQAQGLDAGFHFERDGAHPFRGQGARVPTFDEVLAAFPKQRLLVEVKPEAPGIERAFAEALRRHDAVGRVCFGSERDAVAERLRAELPDACMFYPRDAALRFAAGVWGLAPLEADPRYDVLAIPLMFEERVVADETFLRAARSLDVPVYVWVVDEPAEMTRLIEHGVAGIVTDRPDLLQTVLAARPA